MVGVGLGTAWLIRTRPETLRVPPWVAYAACACFVLAGVAIAVQGAVARRTYAWLMVALLALMAAIPAWIAVGPGERQCTAAPIPLGALGCRIGFGLGTLLVVAMLAVAVRQARRD